MVGYFGSLTTEHDKLFFFFSGCFRYDVKSVSPRQVEDLLVDQLRVRDASEVRRILQGYPELLPSEKVDETSGSKSDQDKIRVESSPPSPSSTLSSEETGIDRNGGSGSQQKRSGFVQKNKNEEDGRGDAKKYNKPCDHHSGAAGDRNNEMLHELLAALSRAAEEEIRGAKGLFGLENGALERLKGGARVTPFLRHGSLRRQVSVGAAPHGLAASGMKKWWRCPKCHVSQVGFVGDVRATERTSKCL